MKIRSAFLLLAAAGLIILSTSCSVVLETDADQCQTDVDCTNRGPDWKFTSCSPEHVCVQQANLCVSDQQCIELNGGKPFLCPAETRHCVPGCLNDQQCIDNNGGHPFLCNLDTKACVPGCTTNQQCIDDNGGHPFVCNPTTKACVPGCTTDRQCIDDNGGHPFLCDLGTKQCVKGCSTDRQCIDDNGGHPFLCDPGTKQCIVGCSTDQQCIDDNAGKPFLCDTGTKTCIEGCSSDKQCRDANPGQKLVCTNKKCVDGCINNAECVDDNGGQPFICRKDTRKCVGLLSGTNCPQVLSDGPAALKNDDTLVVGLLCSQGGTAGSLGPPCIEGAELARSEFARVGGLTMGTKIRPVAFVNCDNNLDPEGALDQLLNVIGVHAILGPSNSGVMASDGPKRIEANHVIAVSGAAVGVDVDPILAASKNLFRLFPGDIAGAELFVKYVSDVLEPLIRQQLGLAPTDPIKIAVPAASDAAGVGILNYLSTNLRYNGGKTPAENLDNFKPIDYGNPSTDVDTAAKQAAAAQTIIAYQPHILLMAGRAEALSGLTKPIEQGWTNATYRPRYLYRSTLFASSTATFVNTTFPTNDAAREDLRIRMIGVAPTSTNPLIEADYKLRHHSKWDGFVHTALASGTIPAPVSPGPTQTSAAFYDATYALFGATVATKKEDPTGDEIALAMPFTQPVTSGAAATIVPVGPTSIVSLQQQLAAGTTIDLNGALSNMNFKDHTIFTKQVIWCMPKPGTDNKVKAPIATDLTYDPDTKTLTGTLPVNGVLTSYCPL